MNIARSSVCFSSSSLVTNFFFSFYYSISLHSSCCDVSTSSLLFFIFFCLLFCIHITRDGFIISLSLSLTISYLNLNVFFSSLICYTLLFFLIYLSLELATCLRVCFMNKKMLKGDEGNYVQKLYALFVCFSSCHFITFLLFSS